MAHDTKRWSRTRLAAAQAIPPENKNFLLLSKTWTKRQSRRLGLYARVLDYVDAEYSFTEPVARIAEKLADHGFSDMTVNVVNNLTQPYRAAIRYFTTEDPEERKRLEERLHKDSRLLGVRCLLEDEITWEMITFPPSRAAQAPLLALTSEEVGVLVGWSQRLQAVNDSQLKRLAALEESKTVLERDILHLGSLLEEAQRQLSEAQEKIKALEKQQAENKVMIDMFEKEINRHIREKEGLKVARLEEIAPTMPEHYRELARIIEKEKAKTSEVKNGDRTPPEGFPRKKVFADGREVAVEYEEEFWKKYGALPEAVKKKIPDVLVKIASSENELGAHQALHSEPIELGYSVKGAGRKRLERFIGCMKSWIDHKYRLIWQSADGRFVIRFVYAHGEVD